MNTLCDFSPWIGRSENVADDIGLSTAQAAAAIFNLDPEQLRPGAPLPPLWHWFYFLPKVSQSRLGADGHPNRELDSFMPPLPFPRRMFAGARLTWHRPLTIGRAARRQAVIRSIETKAGRSGSLAFVTVVCRYFLDQAVGAASQQSDTLSHPADSDLCLEEEQDIVYREPGPSLLPPKIADLPPVPQGAWSKTIVPDTRLLFRFSALTFNSHRIHYDRPYATAEEGYPGLIVHGPMIAMMLLQLVRDNTQRAIKSFRFRSQSPLYDLAPFRLVAIAKGQHVDLEAVGPDAKTAMIATAELA